MSLEELIQKVQEQQKEIDELKENANEQNQAIEEIREECRDFESGFKIIFDGIGQLQQKFRYTIIKSGSYFGVAIK